MGSIGDAISGINYRATEVAKIKILVLTMISGQKNQVVLIFNLNGLFTIENENAHGWAVQRAHMNHGTQPLLPLLQVFP